jgi:hypothetical protein
VRHTGGVLAVSTGVLLAGGSIGVDLQTCCEDCYEIRTNLAFAARDDRDRAGQIQGASERK